MLTLIIQEMSKEFPTLMDTLVHERDQFVHLPLFCLMLITLFLFQNSALLIMDSMGFLNSNRNKLSRFLEKHFL